MPINNEIQQIKIFLRTGQLITMEGNKIDETKLFTIFRDKKTTYLVKTEEIIYYTSTDIKN